MFRLRRWYNQNSKTIWKITGIVVFLIIVLQVLNYFAGRQNNIEYNSNIINLSKQEYTDLSLSTDKSVLTDEKISNSQAEGIDVLNTFFAYCNAGKIKEAYNLLTDECKEEMYPNLKGFNDSYYKKVFNGEKKNISLENWIGNIYKVDIVDDILSTGKYDENSTKQDYITITSTKDNKYKLNINSYIGRTEINKSNTFYNDIQIDVEKKDVYMDYEIYTYKITNKKNSPVVLDNLLNINSMYIEDQNGIKYFAYTHEHALNELLINKGESREISIKYYNKYGSNKKIKKVVFSKLVLDYNAYENLQNKDIFNNYIELKIDL